MTTITKGWLQQTIAEFENTRDDIPFGLSDDDARILIVLKRALASLEREQVRHEHAEWSDATFGDVGPIGPLKHLSKEALEAAADPSDPLEWADMQFLLWDAQRHMGFSDEFITRAMIEKLEINKSRQWPEPKDGEPRLHIKEQPTPVVPEKLPCSVELKPGLIIGKGCKTETLLTALRRRADYYAKIDAFTPAERAEHDASIEAFKAMLPTPADSQGRPRAPVVPPAIEPDYKVIKSILPTTNPDEYACCIADDMWNACRAAILQGGQPVSNRDELQVIGWLRSDYNSDDKRDPNAPLFMLGRNDPSETWGVKYIPLSGNSPVTPDSWISCSERMPAQDDWVLIYSKYGEYLAGQVQGEYVELNDGTLSWLGAALHWMPLPAPPQQ